jgi:hypothetical protein
MKKQGLAILLVIPLAVAAFAFVKGTALINQVETNITGIAWDYPSDYAVSLSEKEVKLDATAVYDSRYPLGEGNELVWSLSGMPDDEAIASIEKKDDGYYLDPLYPGNCTLTCGNEKGTVAKSLTLTVYGGSGAIVINPETSWSGSKIGPTNYAGLYDLSYSKLALDSYAKKLSSIKVDVATYGEASAEADWNVKTSDNISFNSSTGMISFLSAGSASLSIDDPFGGEDFQNGSLSFTIVDAVNVYSYDDLLMATNFSSSGEPAVLRINLDSLDDTYKDPEDGDFTPLSSSTALFGNYDAAKGAFSFADEAVSSTTTYNHEFVDGWNDYVDSLDEAGTNANGYLKASESVITGIEFKKDFYGNGFLLNAHNLTYPSTETAVDENGGTVYLPTLGQNDLFRGPKFFFSLGVPKDYGETNSDKAAFPIFALYGQDNSAFSVEGDGVTLNDVHLRGCDFGNNLTNLEYTGTVLELKGSDVTIANSIIENGRNCVRAYSSMGDVISNSLIRNAMEFCLKLGSNEMAKVSDEGSVAVNGGSMSKSDFLKRMDLTDLSSVPAKDYTADSLLTSGCLIGHQGNEFLGVATSPYTAEELSSAIAPLQEAFSNQEGVLKDGQKDFHGSMAVKDVYFSGSGLSAIDLDAAYGGSFLHNMTSTLIMLLLGLYAPYSQSGLCGTSYPVKLTIGGDTRFYDWKKTSSLDYSSLLFQNIGGLITAHGGLGSGFEVSVSDDDYLPLRKMIEDGDDGASAEYMSDGTAYSNIPIFLTGGGANLSEVDFETSAESLSLDSPFSLSPYESSLSSSTPTVSNFGSNPLAKYEAMKIAMSRAAFDILGFSDWTMYSMDVAKALYFGKSASVSDLQTRASEQ